MATLSATIPVSHEVLAAQRKWRWAAILLQVEAFGALMMGALYLLRSTGTVSPVAACMGLVAAALLFPLGTAIERGSRGAGLVLAIMYSLRAFQLVLAPLPVLMRMGPLVLFEGWVFGRAILAMTNSAAPVPAPGTGERVRNLLITIIPIALAVSLFQRGPLYYHNAVVSDVQPEQARAIIRTLGSLLVCGGVMLVLLHRVPQRISLAVRGRELAMPAFVSKLPGIIPWSLQVWMDFTIGATTLAGSLYMLDWFFDAASRSGAMLIAGVLIFPLVALLCVPLGIVWIVVGIAEIRGKTWARTLRFAAAVPQLMVMMLALPLLKDLAVSFLRRF
jgi:hypothetical protein